MTGFVIQVREQPDERRLASRALLVVCLCLALLLPGLAVAPASSAPLIAPSSSASSEAAPDDGRIVVAQSFFQRLFKRREKTKKRYAPPPKRSRKKKTVRKAAAEPVVQTVAKDDDATVIAVFGDELAMDMALGLKDAFSKIPDVRIDSYGVKGTGLVRRANRNKLKTLDELLTEKSFGYAVVMVGLNDRVEMPAVVNEEGEQIFPPYEFKSEGWLRSYGREIDRLRLAFAQKDKTILWVGMPPVGNKDWSSDLLFLNDFVSNRITERGERFIDIWDAFANDEGQFTSRGPDLSGQERRLRLKSGIRFNRAGRRKLAHYVERLLIRALSQSADDFMLPSRLANADEAALLEGRGATRDIYVLRKPPIDSDILVDPDTFAASQVQSDTITVQANSRVPEYRADNFAWTSAQ